MKKKRVLSFLLAGLMTATMLSGCSSNNTDSKSTGTESTDSAATVTEPAASTTEPDENAEIIDGRFVETRKITVEVYDRSNDGGSKPEDNFFTDYIKEGMLRDHNVEVTYQIVPRWTETEVLNNLLAAGDAPDICVTYSYPTVQAYANMGGVTDLAPIIEEYWDYIPNLVNLLTEENIYYDLDPNTGTLWAVEARLFNRTPVVLFVREDWLNKLGLSEPKTMEEFEAMLYAFKDNAELLLGADADKMVPFSITTDVGFRMMDISESYIPNDITDKDYYIYSYDDRKLMFPSTKEAMRKLNEWYNAGLTWNDFAVHTDSGTVEGDTLIKAGYVGSLIQNSDQPYRNGDDGWTQSMMRMAGDDAAYITVAAFENEAGLYRKYMSSPVDRKVFFPASNSEPLASLLYLDWISKQENLTFLQTGEEGANHEVLPDGAIQSIAVTGEKIMNSQYNIDYTITCNGLHLENEELTLKSLALGYSGIDASYIERSFDVSEYSIRNIPHAVVGEIEAEQGMDTVLKEKRDNLLAQAVVASPDKFDSVWDAGMRDYLNSGGQAIIDERTAAWEAAYGDKVMLD